MKALIIEDELLASKHLRQVLGEAGDFDVIGVLESISETIEWFGNHPQPEIVFMDIHLADGTAFEIFNHISINCPIIFTTAYDEYALRAFKVNSVDYLLKPIEADDVKEALRKLELLSGSDRTKDTLTNLLKSFRKETRYKTTFLIPVKGDKLIPVQVNDIAFICIDASLVKAYLSDGKTYRLDSTLDELMEQLNPEFFFRANRQYIISRSAIKDIDFWFNSRLSVNLKIQPPEKILISKARIQEFKNWFGG